MPAKLFYYYCMQNCQIDTLFIALASMSEQSHNSILENKEMLNKSDPFKVTKSILNLFKRRYERGTRYSSLNT